MLVVSVEWTPAPRTNQGRYLPRRMRRSRRMRNLEKDGDGEAGSGFAKRLDCASPLALWGQESGRASSAGFIPSPSANSPPGAA